jgi:hypothetical protein
MPVAVLVGTAKGLVVLRAGAARDRFETSPLLLKGWIVTATTRDPAGRAYVGVTHDVWGASILMSDDLEHWDPVEAVPRYQPGQGGNDEHLRIVGGTDPMGRFAGGGRHVDQIWKLHADRDVVYAGVSEAGLFASRDQGKSWQVSPGLDEHPTRASWGAGFGGLCAHSILTDARNADRIWVGISAAGVFRSDDGGLTFEKKNEGVPAAPDHCVHSLAHDPNDADVIFRQDHRGMYRSDDGGDHWHSIESGLPVAQLSDDLRCAFGFVAELDPKTGSVFALPLEGDSFRFAPDGELRVYRTQDRGESWQPFAAGLPERCYANVLRGAMSVDGADPAGVYFGTTSGCVYGSADLGESWRELASGLPRIVSVDAIEV